MGKKKLKAAGDAIQEPIGLHVQLADESANEVKTKKPKRKLADNNEPDQDQEQFVDDKLSKKILKFAAKQKTEEEGTSETAKPSKQRKTFHEIRLRDDDEVSEDDTTDYVPQDQIPETTEMDADLQSAFDKFLMEEPQQRVTLYDLIEQKIAAKQTQVQEFMCSSEELQLRDMPERVVQMYSTVGVLLASYRSGRLPKAFKLIPKLSNWEQVLSLTQPQEWTASAMFAATRIFVSNLNARMCQRFLNLVLLPRIRDDIEEYKRLNYHLYQALHKALFKPAAFFKGILLPLSESGTCTLREATIVCSVLSKSTIPMLHAAAAMLKLAEMNYSGANSMFLRALIDKKYTLPYQVIDGLVNHFVRFTHDQRELPVLWHQALLSFVQRYKSDLSEDQIHAVYDLMKHQSHYQITAEVRRELHMNKPRDVEQMES